MPRIRPPLPQLLYFLLLFLPLLSSAFLLLPAAAPSLSPSYHHKRPSTLPILQAKASHDIDTNNANTNNDTDDDYFMQLALVEAQAAFAAQEIPVGAVLVSSEGQVLAKGRNRVEETGDASAHAELECLRAAASVAARREREKDGHWRMLDCTLYVTLEPCLMCLGATQSFRVKRVVYGARNTLLGAIESYVKVLEQGPHPFHTLEVQGGVRAEECGGLMREFFVRRRQNKEQDYKKGGGPTVN